MKKTMKMLMAAVAFLCGAAWADTITEEQARTVAETFVTKDAIGQRILPSRTVDAVTRRGGLWLVTLKPSGHLFVSANRSAEPILSFSEHAFVEPQPGSPQQALLALAETNALNATGSQYESRWRKLLGERMPMLTMASASANATESETESVNIEPLVKSNWGQNYPFNGLSPVINKSHTPVGCVATAYDQIMRYWEWPEVLDEDIVTEHSVDSLWGHKWRLLAGTDFEWADSPYDAKTFDSKTSLRMSRQAIFAGMIARMGYNTQSGAQTGRPGVNRWYTPYTCLDTSNSTPEKRKEAMIDSLRQGCPFMVSVNTTQGGHAVVGDGWMTSSVDGSSWVHLNYGWQGTDSTTYYNLSTPLGVYLYQKPRPMVLNRPMHARSALPVTLKWAFPTKGYENNLKDFAISYTEVSDDAADWSDDLSTPKGTLSGTLITAETIANCGDGNVLKIGTKVESAYYTWPTVVATKNTKLSYDIHSRNANGMYVEVQLFDPATGWTAIDTPEISAASELDWSQRTVDLSAYAGKSIAIRIFADRPSSSAFSYNDDTVRENGVHFDNMALSQVREAELETRGTTVVDGSQRSAAISDAALATGKTYLFKVTPRFTDATVGIPGCEQSCTIMAENDAEPTIASVSSVTSDAPKFTEDMQRYAYFGLNQIGVYGSSAMSRLTASLNVLSLIGEVSDIDTITGDPIVAHGKVSLNDAVTVEKKSNGNFLVRVDASMLTEYVSSTEMILTLRGYNDAGDVSQKDVCLYFNKTGGETRIDIKDLPDPESADDPDVPSVPDVPEVPSDPDPTDPSDPDPTDPSDPDPTDDPDVPSVPEVPSDPDPNDFTEGGVNYRFCNGVDKTSGYKDLDRVGYYAYQAPGAYNLVLWWADAYKALTGVYPTGYAAPSTSSFPGDGTVTTFPDLAVKLFKEATSTALPTDAERAAYFPVTAYSASDWCGGATGDAMVKAAGRRIYNRLANGPIGILIPTSSTRSYGGVIWGCEYACDDDGEYATVIYFTSTKSNGDNVEKATLANVTVSGVGTMPGLKGFNSNGGVIKTYYPIVGPAHPEDPEDPESDDPDVPSVPDVPEVPSDPDTPSDDPITEADDSDNPGNSYTDTYKYEIYDNYYTARKRAIKQGKQLFILSGAAWCSNCAFVKNYLTSLGTPFSDKFVVYYADHDSTVCRCFQGGLPQYGAADPRDVDAFTGTLDGTTRSWDLAWQTTTCGIYRQDRGGYDAARVDNVVNEGKARAKYDDPTNLVIRGLATLGTGTTGRYELYAQFKDGVEMPVDYGVDWQVVSGNGAFTDVDAEGRDMGALKVTSGTVVIRATSTFYFTGSKTMTVACAPESDIESVEIVTREVNLEDDATPTIEAQATLKDGKKIPVFGFGTWTATFKEKLPRTACPELDEDAEGVTSPTITIDDESRLNYALIDGLLKVCDQKIDVTLTVNGKTTTREITVWGPTKVIASKWTMLSGDRQTTLGVVRLNCTELTYNYGGQIKTTTDTYFASYATVLQCGIASQTSYHRGLTVFVDNVSEDKSYTVDLKAQKVNGKYKGYTPALNTASSRAAPYTSLARGTYATSLDKGLVPAGFFRAFFPTASADDYAALADEDTDKDGFKNWEEYVLGTDPTKSGDTFALMQGYQHLTAPAANGATMQYKVMYTQRAGRTYYIDAKETWDADWTHVATVDLANLNANAVTTFTDLQADLADKGMFFRVRAALSEHVSTYMTDAPVIAPNMLVANRGSVIDLSTATLPLDLSSFDTDATDPGTVWVKVAADIAAGTALIRAPKSAEASLKACKPKDSGDVAFEVATDPTDANRLVLRVKGPVPAIEGGEEKGTLEITDEKIVVTPRDNVTDIAIENPGDRKVEIPPSIERIGGVADSGKIVVRGGGHDITKAMKFTDDNGGFKIELNAEAKVTINGEEIAVTPELANGANETPFEMRDGEVVFSVKTIPGLKYQVLASETLDTNGFTAQGAGESASSTRHELKLKPTTTATQGFYKIQVSR